MDDESEAAAAGVPARVEQLETELRSVRAEANRRERQLLLALVGILDGFNRLERAIGAESLSEDVRRVVDRFALVRRKLESSLEREGVMRINSLGLEPNPELHDVFDERDAAGAEDGKIVEVDEEGYLYRGEPLRRAKVVVAKT